MILLVTKKTKLLHRYENKFFSPIVLHFTIFHYFQIFLTNKVYMLARNFKQHFWCTHMYLIPICLSIKNNTKKSNSRMRLRVYPFVDTLTINENKQLTKCNNVVTASESHVHLHLYCPEPKKCRIDRCLIRYKCFPFFRKSGQN